MSIQEKSNAMKVFILIELSVAMVGTSGGVDAYLGVPEGNAVVCSKGEEF